MAAEVAVLVSSYQRPWHVRRVLESLRYQDVPAGTFEVVVTDDGSTDETAAMVRAFADSAPFEVQFVTHEHNGFQLARCRNEGVAASSAPYILFLDGDCLVAPDHIRTHLTHRRVGRVCGTVFHRLTRAASASISLARVADGSFRRLTLGSERRRLAILAWKSEIYQRFGHPTRPKLMGCNIGLWRSDYERVNGYDENFVGWGCEDDDLRARLARAGMKIRSLLRYTSSWHLWHPTDPTAAARWREGANVGYLQRGIRLTRCVHGLVARESREIAVRVTGAGRHPEIIKWLPKWLRHAPQAPEIDILVLPGEGSFHPQADCRVLVVAEHAPVPENLWRQAHLVFVAPGAGSAVSAPWYHAREMDDVLRRELLARHTPKVVEPAVQRAA